MQRLARNVALMAALLLVAGGIANAEERTPAPVQKERVYLQISGMT